MFNWCHDRLLCNFDGAHDGSVMGYLINIFLMFYSASLRPTLKSSLHNKSNVGLTAVL